MLDLVIFAVLNGLIISMLIYFDSVITSEEGEEKSYSEIFKFFLIIFFITFVLIFLFKNIGNKNMYDLPVEVELP
jgi:hypothetical protein